jgi:hypothetical protein
LAIADEVNTPPVVILLAAFLAIAPMIKITLGILQ